MSCVMFSRKVNDLGMASNILLWNMFINISSDWYNLIISESFSWANISIKFCYLLMWIHFVKFLLKGFHHRFTGFDYYDGVRGLEDVV